MTCKRFRVTVLVITACLLGLGLAACAKRSPQVPTPLDQLPPADVEGWITLFAGTGLDGWVNARDAGAENKWSIEHGAMTNVEHGNDIATKALFGDFELFIEYKTVPAGNSGVYLRGRIEIQVFDSNGKAAVDKADAGAIYDMYAPAVNAAKPAGEWNSIEARYVGNRLTVKLNGQVVQDNVTVDDVTGGALPGDVNEAGPLMLQGDHGKVWYRNIRIRPVKGQG